MQRIRLFDGMCQNSYFWMAALLLIGLGSLPAQAQIDCINIGNGCQPANPNVCIDVPDEDSSCCTGVPNPCDPGEICCPCEGPCNDPNDITFPCGQPPIVALTDVSADPYVNPNDPNLTQFPPGLYTNGGTPTNTIPTTHKDVGMAGGDKIVPRNASGVVDHTAGFIGVLSIGFSNPSQEFGNMLTNKIETLTGTLDGLNDRLVFINGAKPTNVLCAWENVDLSDPDENPWGNICEVDGDIRLPGRQPGQGSTDIGGLKASQIQVVWMKNVNDDGAQRCTQLTCTSCPVGMCNDLCHFPAWSFDPTAGEVAKLKTVIQNIRDVFPNVRQVYMTSRSYGGLGNETDVAGGEQNALPCNTGSLEPWAFENGFSMRGLIQEQLNGNLPFGTTDEFIWTAWGPYIWANGDIPTAALPYETSIGNLVWTCEKSCADGQHPSRDEDVEPGLGQISGQFEVGQRLYAFFHNTDITQEWFLEKPVIASSIPINGWIDAREDRDFATGTIPEGLTEITITFDKPVFDLSGTQQLMTASSFEIQCTGGLAPSIVSPILIENNNTKVTLTLNAPIPAGHWTTVIAHVKDADGNVIRRDPWDRLDFGFLPADADGSKTSNTADVTFIEEQHNNPPTNPDEVKLDQDRNMVIESADRLRCIHLLDGFRSGQEWDGVSLPARP